MVDQPKNGQFKLLTLTSRNVESILRVAFFVGDWRVLKAGESFLGDELLPEAPMQVSIHQSCVAYGRVCSAWLLCIEHSSLLFKPVARQS